jgi:hypothetical protein
MHVCSTEGSPLQERKRESERYVGKEKSKRLWKSVAEFCFIFAKS